MNTQASKNGIIFTSFSVFLFSAISLVVPSGYSYGAALLLLGSLPIIFFVKRWPKLSSDDKKILLVLGFYSVVWISEILATGQSSREFDKPSRFILAMAALLLLVRFPPKTSFIWSGIAIGAIAAGSWSLWQKIFLGVDRAGGYTHVIQYGNISMLFGVICLAGLGWASCEKHHNRWVSLLLLGFLFGFLASMLSGSRGGWIGIPFVAIILYTTYKPWINKRALAYITLSALSLLIIVYSVPQTGVQHRINKVIHNIELYQQGNADTSVGHRLHMWKGAVQLFIEKPLFGWGEPGYMSRMKELADEGFISQVAAEFGHAHNEYLDVASKRGILGLIALLLLYIMPLRLFMKSAKSQDLRTRSIAISGSLLCVCFIDFSLTQAFMSHNSGVMIYSFMLVILWTANKKTQS